MNIKSIFKQKASLASLFIAIVLSTAGCKKGAFDINNNPNTPTSVPAKYSLSSALTATATLQFGGNSDFLDNWMGYWMQSGAYSASPTYALYQLTNSDYNGNWTSAYVNLENYSLIQRTAGTDPTQANFRGIAMIMNAYVYQRIVDLYSSAPYTSALAANAQFSYPYDSGSSIYAKSIAKIDSAVTIISGAPTTAVNPGTYDVMFGGKMTNWLLFAKTLKLKMLMRQTQNGIGDAGVKTALASYTQADFLGAGVDAAINPGYSSTSNAQENPFYYDIVKDYVGNPGANTLYYRANAYAVNFYKNHNDPRSTAFYFPATNTGTVVGRVYGSTGTESNQAISAIRGTGFTSNGATKTSSQDAVILPAFESLFLQAEAIQRGYIAGNAATTFKSAVAESFRILGVTDAANAAEIYTNQADALTNYTAATNKIQAIITQKWAACNTYDPLESYSDWRRLSFPSDLPVSIYPGNTATHIPYRLPYPVSETSYNSTNVPAGGTAQDIFTAKIFWMP